MNKFHDVEKTVDYSSYQKRLNNEWIAKELFGWAHHVPDYLGDYVLLGMAWSKLKHYYKDRHIFLAGDGVYIVNNVEVVYSGHAYNYAVQLIFSVEDCEQFGLPKTPMSLIYGAIVDEILENPEDYMEQRHE